MTETPRGETQVHAIVIPSEARNLYLEQRILVGMLRLRTRSLRDLVLRSA
jgi:hypothetical protein